MIKCDQGNVKLSGTGIKLLAEYSAITSAMTEVLSEKADEEYAKSKLKLAFEASFKTEEELIEDVTKTCEKLTTGKTEQLLEALLKQRNVAAAGNYGALRNAKLAENILCASRTLCSRLSLSLCKVLRA